MFGLLKKIHALCVRIAIVALYSVPYVLVVGGRLSTVVGTTSAKLLDKFVMATVYSGRRDGETHTSGTQK